MTYQLENYVERYIKRYHHKMHQICEPLQRFFGINYFTYHSISNEGYWRPFVSRPDWADYFTEHQLYLHDPLILPAHCYQSGHVLWNHCIKEEYVQKTLKIAKERFQLAHGFCIIEKQEWGCEFFGFNAPPECTQIYYTYLHDLPLLKEFCKFFKTEALSILNEIEQDPLPLLDLKGLSFKNAHQSPFEESFSSKSLFLKYIKAKPIVKLSKREKECLNCYLDDLRMQDVAYRLHLSVRTVESYLNNIKNKLNCGDKTELIKKGLELRALGILQ